MMPARPYGVLLADDDELGLKRLRRALAGIKEIAILGSARNGEEAVEMAAELDPDIVLMDIEMPRLNGFEALRKIKPRPLVVFVSGHIHHRETAFDHGAIGYLLKPVATSDIRSLVERVQQLGQVFWRICGHER